MAGALEPPVEEHLRTIAMARILFGAEMSIQAPPNLSGGAAAVPERADAAWASLLAAGINDWGGVSPVTADFVNPGTATLLRSPGCLRA